MRNRPSDPAYDAALLMEPERTRLIIGAFYYVYNRLRFGLLEALYARALEKVLTRTGMQVEREYPVPVYFEGERIGFHRMDMLVDGRIVIEIKSTERLAPGARRQLRNYLAITGLSVGLLLHFGPEATFDTVVVRR
jgi:GxxExxY protein